MKTESHEYGGAESVNFLFRFLNARRSFRDDLSVVNRIQYESYKLINGVPNYEYSADKKHK